MESYNSIKSEQDTYVSNDILYNQTTLIDLLNSLLFSNIIIVEDQELILSANMRTDLNLLKKDIFAAKNNEKFINVFNLWKEKLYHRYLIENNNKTSILHTSRLFESECPSLKNPSFIMLMEEIRKNYQSTHLYPQLFQERIPSLFKEDFSIETNHAILLFNIANKIALTFSEAGADDIAPILSNIFLFIFNKINLVNPEIYGLIFKNVNNWEVSFSVDEKEKKAFYLLVAEYMQLVKAFYFTDNKTLLIPQINSYLHNFKEKFKQDMQDFYPKSDISPFEDKKFSNYLFDLEESLKDLINMESIVSQNICAQIQFFILNSLAEFRTFQKVQRLSLLSKEKIPELFNEDYSINSHNALAIYNIAVKITSSFSNQPDTQEIFSIFNKIVSSIFNKIDVSDTNTFDLLYKQINEWRPLFEINEKEKQKFYIQVNNYITLVTLYFSSEDRQKEFLEPKINNYLDLFEKKFNKDMQSFYPDSNYFKLNNFSKFYDYLNKLKNDLENLLGKEHLESLNKCKRIRINLAQCLITFKEKEPRLKSMLKP